MEAVDDKLREEKTECRAEFVSQKALAQQTVAAIIAVLALLGGSFVWAMNISELTATTKSQLEITSGRLDEVERASREQHRETLTILKEIKEKVSR